MKAVALALLLVAASSSPRVIDGDTLAFGRERVRIANLDAPDVGSHAHCALEQRRGEAARAFARAVIDRAAVVQVVDRQGIDRYGRTLARVLVDDRDFGRVMIAAGHGRPWRGRSSDWCR